MSSKQLTKADFVAKVAVKAGISKKGAETALNAVLESLGDSLKAGYKVPFIGFGSFQVVKRAARQGRNPKTGAPMKIKAANVVKFSAGSKLKERVNK
ncbi:MAG: HU family DNA-binding protein [Francisellaceae bacterium]